MAAMPPPTGDSRVSIAQKPVWRASIPDQTEQVFWQPEATYFQVRSSMNLLATAPPMASNFGRSTPAPGSWLRQLRIHSAAGRWGTVMVGWGGPAGLMNTPAVGAVKPGPGPHPHLCAKRLGDAESAAIWTQKYWLGLPGHYAKHSPPVDSKREPSCSMATVFFVMA